MDFVGNICPHKVAIHLARLPSGGLVVFYVYLARHSYFQRVMDNQAEKHLAPAREAHHMHTGHPHRTK